MISCVSPMYCGFERLNGGDKTNFRLYLRGALFIFCPFRKQIAIFSSQRGFLYTQSTNNNCSGHTLVLCLQSGTPSVCSPPLAVPANCAHFGGVISILHGTTCTQTVLTNACILFPTRFWVNLLSKTASVLFVFQKRY